MNIKGLVAIIGFLLEVYLCSIFITELFKLIQDSSDKSILVTTLTLGGLIAIPIFLFGILTGRRQ